MNPGVTASGPTVAAAAAGGVMPGTDVPVPQGADCSGSHTAKDTTDELVCTTTDADPAAAYNLFLQALPKAGDAVNHESYEKASDGTVVGSTHFSGGTFSGFDFIDIRGTTSPSPSPWAEASRLPDRIEHSP